MSVTDHPRYAEFMEVLGISDLLGVPTPAQLSRLTVQERRTLVMLLERRLAERPEDGREPLAHGLLRVTFEEAQTRADPDTWLTERLFWLKCYRQRLQTEGPFAEQEFWRFWPAMVRLRGELEAEKGEQDAI